MKMRKKLLVLAAALALTVSLSACGENEPTEVTETASAETTTTGETIKVSMTTTPATTTTPVTTLPPLPVMSQYEEYYARNNDMIGWLNIPIYDHDPDPETQRDVDYPVVLGQDDEVPEGVELSEAELAEYNRKNNKYYLTHDFDRQTSRNGAMFVDFKCKFSDTRVRPANIIIYGHNMRTGHTLAKLTTYYPLYFKHKTIPSMAQYEYAPVITFNTLWQEGRYKVFAGMFVNTQTDTSAVVNSKNTKIHINDTVFTYYKQRTITGKESFYSYIARILDRSVFYTDVDLEYGDELLTLSTCYYPMDSYEQNSDGSTKTNIHIDTRFVVFARRVRDGESEEVDTSKAYINPSPLYFDYYYQIYGGSWAGRQWDKPYTDKNGVEHEAVSSKIKGFEKYLASHPDSGAAAPGV